MISLIARNKKIIGGILIGIFIALVGNYLWKQYNDYLDYHKALIGGLTYRDEFKSDALHTKEIQTDLLTGSENKTRIILIQNFNYFDHVSWFSLGNNAKDFSSAYSGILFYDFNPATKDYKLVYKFIPLDVAKENFLPGAKEQGIEKVPLLLSSASLGDIDADGKVELVTHWSYCNFNHCVWDYPIIFGFDGGYYVKWTMPRHELTEYDKKGEYPWGGQKYEREVINLHDNRKYILNGGNFIEYKYLDNNKKPSVISYNIDNQTCWACNDQTYLLDTFNVDTTTKAQNTFHKSPGLKSHFGLIKDFKFIESINFDE